MTDSKILEYRRAYEKANNKELVITFDDAGEFFFIEGLPYKMSQMTTMTQRLLDRIERQSK
jgi:hypothetical protein